MISTVVLSVVKDTVHPVTLPDIDKHIVVYVTKKQGNVPIVRRYMSLCQLTVCMYVHTTKAVNAIFVVNVTVVHGYYRVIFVHILVKNLLNVINATNILLISLT